MSVYMLSVFLQLLSVTCLKHSSALNRKLKGPSLHDCEYQPEPVCSSHPVSGAGGSISFLAMAGPSLLGSTDLSWSISSSLYQCQ